MKKLSMLVAGLVAVLTIVGVTFVWLLRAEVVFPQAEASDGDTDIETTLAFVGDHGAGSDSWKVFELIKREGADLLVSQGDFGYRRSAGEFESVLDATLGPDFPIVPAFGNHDFELRGPDLYRTFFADRLERTPEVVCDGEVSVMTACRYRGIDIVSATPGVLSWGWLNDPADSIANALDTSKMPWKICNWHKNQRVLQLGEKRNGVGWRAYETCRKHGALIVNAHEHSYSRTFPITKMSDTPSFDANSSDVVEVQPGRSVVIVSGLGGKSIRRQRRFDPWFAAAYTSDQNAKAGGLFCTFPEGGKSERAECRFVNIDGEVIDRFNLVRRKPSDVTLATK